MLWWVVGGIVLLFGAVAFRGAPYVPTHKRTVEQALDALSLKPGELVVDLGSGDGVFLKAAAQRGLRAVGYEINPLLCLIAWLRCWPVRHLVTIRLRDFWLTPLPADARAVFVFLAGPYMKKLARKLQHAATGHRPLAVVSYGFAIPGLTAQKAAGGLFIYRVKK